MTGGDDREDWRAPLEAAFSSPIARSAPVAGGDIAMSLRVEFANGERCFLKCYSGGPGGIASCEAAGLAWLAETRVIETGHPIVHGEDWLALRWIESGRPTSGTAGLLGRGLAELHRAGAPEFGGPSDNWLARLPQRNEPCPDWAVFYGERRLRPLLRRARDAGLLDAGIGHRTERLIESLAERVGPSEPPARLHGDLWSGNVMTRADGAPVLIDPAVYAGHREVDLAMMRLFGGFDAAVFDAYEEVWPLAPGARDRVALYQTYPVLAHVCLFGRGHAGRLEQTLRACGV